MADGLRCHRVGYWKRVQSFWRYRSGDWPSASAHRAKWPRRVCLVPFFFFFFFSIPFLMLAAWPMPGLWPRPFPGEKVHRVHLQRVAPPPPPHSRRRNKALNQSSRSPFGISLPLFRIWLTFMGRDSACSFSSFDNLNNLL